MATSEIPQPGKTLKEKLRRVWNVGSTERAFGEDFMLSYSFYYVGKVIFWNMPRTAYYLANSVARVVNRRIQQNLRTS